MYLSLENYLLKKGLFEVLSKDERKSLNEPNLSQYIQRLDEDISEVARQMFSLAIEYLKQSGDVNDYPKFLHITDFNFDSETKKVTLIPHSILKMRSPNFKEVCFHTRAFRKEVGQHELCFIPPELCSSLQKEHSLEKSYVFSVAASIHLLVTGRRAFGQKKNFFQDLQSIVFNSYEPPEKLSGSNLGFILETAFNKNPEERLDLSLGASLLS